MLMMQTDKVTRTESGDWVPSLYQWY